LHGVTPGNLQSVRSVVLIGGGIEKAVEMLDDQGSICNIRQPLDLRSLR